MNKNIIKLDDTMEFKSVTYLDRREVAYVTIEERVEVCKETQWEYHLGKICVVLKNGIVIRSMEHDVQYITALTETLVDEIFN